MTYVLRLLVLMAACVCVAPAATVTWSGGPTGFWEQTGNWPAQHEPDATDDVVIPTGVVVTIRTAAVAHSIASAGGITLIAPGALDVGTTITMAGQFTFGGGTLSSATLATTGAGSYVATTTDTTLSNDTVGAGTIIDLSQVNGARLSIAGGMTLNGTIKIGTTDNSRFAVLSATNSQSWGGSGSILFGGSTSNQITLVATSMTLATSVTIQGQAGQFNASNTGTTLVNASGGTISANIAGGPITITSSIATLTNNGTLKATAGGALTINATAWTSVGTVGIAAVTADGGTLTLGGSFATAATTTAHVLNGGVIQLSGTLANGNNFFNPANTGGSWFLTGGSVVGGTLSGAGGLIGTTSDGTLSGVTVSAASTVDLGQVNGARCSITNGMTLNGIIKIGTADNSKFGVLSATNTQAWGGTGSILFGGSTSNQITLVATSMTLSSGVTIHGNSGQFNASNTGTTLANSGTISADTASGILTVTNSIATVANTGTLEATAGGTLDLKPLAWNSTGNGIAIADAGALLLGGAFSTTSAQAASILNAGTISISSTGVLTNTNNIFFPVNTGGSWFLAGGTIVGGTISGAGGLIGTTSDGTLNGVTISTGTIVDLTQVNGARCSIAGSLALNGTIIIGTTDNSRFGVLSATNSQVWSGSGSVLFGGSSSNQITLVATNMTLTTVVTIHGNSGQFNASNTGTTLANVGVISADTASGILTVTNSIATVANTGTLKATAGGTLDLKPLAWNSSGNGIVVADAGTLLLGGAFSTASAQAASILNAGTISISSTGVLTNTGNVFTPASTGGSWSLLGGTIVGGTINGAGGLIGTTSDGTLSGVTISTGTSVDLGQVNGARCSIANGMTLNGIIKIGTADNSKFGVLSATNTQAWGGTGSILFGGSTSNQITLVATNMMLSSGVTIHGNSGQFNASNTGTTLANSGTISADTASGILTVTNSIATVANTGTLKATAGGTLDFKPLAWNSSGNGIVVADAGTLLLGGAFSTTSAQAASILNAGTISISSTGVLTNTGNVFTPASTGGSWSLLGGAIVGGTISGAGGLIGTTSDGTLNGVTISTASTVDLGLVNGARCSIANGMTLNGIIRIGTADNSKFGVLSATNTQAWGGTGSILFGGSTSNQITLVATNMTLSSGVTIHGNSGQFNASNTGTTLANSGTISADTASGILTVTNSIATVANTGTLKATAGGTLDLKPLAWNSSGNGIVVADAGTLLLGGAFSTASAQAASILNAGTISISSTGVLTNTGNVFTPASTGGSWSLLGGTIVGGTISGAGGLIGTTSDGTLSGVTISTGTSVDLGQVNGARCSIANGMTLNGIIKIGTADNSKFGVLSATNTQAWGGTGSILFGGSTSNQITLVATNMMLSSGVTIHGNSGQFNASNTGTTLANSGTIATDVAGGSLTISIPTFTNAGTLTLGAGFAQTWNATGAFTQTSTGVMNVEILAAASADKLAVTGSATLAGTLNLTTNGFVPTTGQTFSILTTTTGRSGTFATVNGNFTLNTANANNLLAVANAASIPGVVVTTATTLTKVQPITFTLTFSEAVTGLTTAGLTVTNGTLGTISGGPAVYTVPVTPITQGTVGLAVNAGAAHNAGNAANTASATANVTFDSVAPTVTFAPSGITTAQQPIAFTLTFSESVTGLAANDLTVTNGTVGTITGGGATFTVPVTPTATGAVTVQLKAAGVTDLAGNANALSAVDTVTFDSSAVTVAVSPASGATNSSVITFTLTFSQPVTGLAVTGLAATNGALSNLSGSGDTFTVDVTPAAQGAVTLQVEAAATTSAASGVPNQVSNLASLAFDSVSPSVAISPDGTTTSNSPITFTMTFSEAVTGFSSGDISVTNGTLLTLTGGPAVYTFTVAPSESGQVTAHLGSDAAHDAAGNLNTDSNLATVTFAPATPAVTVVVTAAAPLVRTAPVSFSVVFSAPVAGFGLDDLTVGNGTATLLSGSGATYTVAVDPIADGAVTLAVVAGAVVDGSDNGSLASNVASSTFDSTPPRARITLAGAIPVTTSVTLDVVFSEPVTGFALGRITATNATLSTFTALDAATYSVVLTPTSTSASPVVTIAGDACNDAAGNPNLRVTATIPVESPLVSTTVTTPPIPLSAGNLVVYSALGPGTSSGLEQVRAFLASRSNSQARGFIWDAGAQAYVQVPSAGWQPFAGVFLATREAPTFDFNGHATTLDFTLTLRPGYNFICVPPLADGGTVLVDHAFADLALEDTGGAVIGGATRDALIGTGVFAWDGTAYSQVDTLHTGTGYWIENASSPPVDLVLRRTSQQVLTTVATLPSARTIGARPRSSPPPPPGGAASGSSAGSGGGKACGAGSGIAALALAFLALARLRLRSPRRA